MSRDSEGFAKVIGENPGSLLVSGKVLNEAVEKTFKGFVGKVLAEGEKQGVHKRIKLKRDITVIKSLNDMM